MPARKILCQKCKKDIGKSGSIQCKSCVLWFHLPCAGVDEQFVALSSKNSGVSYKCKDCCDKPNSFNLLNTKLDNLSVQISSNNDAIDKKLESIVVNIRGEFVSRFERLEEEVANFNALVKGVDAGVDVKLKKLEEENNTLHHRLNRTDVVVSGLPKDISNLEETIKNLCRFYGISVDDRDIQHVCYMNRKQSVLVKFCNVFIRDKLMAEYHKTRSLKLGDVDRSGISTRVFLNDHFGPMASKINFICRQLLKKNKIKKFKIYNADKPKVSITYPNGSDILMGFERCIKELLPMVDN